MADIKEITTEEITTEEITTVEEATGAMNAVDEAVEQIGGRKKLVNMFGHRKVQLTDPFTWAKKTYTEIDMDFTKLTGVDMLAITDELTALRQSAKEPADNVRYQVKLAAKAAGIPSDVIEHLPASDFNAVVTAAHYFLMI